MLLGGALGEKSINGFAYQVRMIAPTLFGLVKGVLVRTPGIDKIMIPTSMIKCGESKSTNPVHAGDVMIIISGCFLSDKGFSTVLQENYQL